MLVISLSVGDQFRIGPKGEVVVKFLERRGSDIKVGIEAPRHIRVLRESVFQRILAAAPVDPEPSLADQFAALAAENLTLGNSGGG